MVSEAGEISRVVLLIWSEGSLVGQSVWIVGLGFWSGPCFLGWISFSFCFGLRFVWFFCL